MIHYNKNQKPLNDFFPMEIIYNEGWKGKDEISIFEDIKCYIIINHRKDKETEKINTKQFTIPRENVDILWQIILKQEQNSYYAARYLWRKIIIYYQIDKKDNIHIENMINSFNGGYNRSKYYFPLYYYPLKILEAKGYIKYSGRGGAMRLKTDLQVK